MNCRTFSPKILASEEKATATYFEDFARNQTVFDTIAMLQPVRKTWRPLFGFFVRTVNSDVAIG